MRIRITAAMQTMDAAIVMVGRILFGCASGGSVSGSGKSGCSLSLHHHPFIPTGTQSNRRAIYATRTSILIDDDAAVVAFTSRNSTRCISIMRRRRITTGVTTTLTTTTTTVTATATRTTTSGVGIRRRRGPVPTAEEPLFLFRYDGSRGVVRRGGAGGRGGGGVPRLGDEMPIHYRWGQCAASDDGNRR